MIVGTTFFASACSEEGASVVSSKEDVVAGTDGSSDGSVDGIDGADSGSSDLVILADAGDTQTPVGDTGGGTDGVDDDVSATEDAVGPCDVSGCSCQKPDDCESGYCVPGPDGLECADACVDSCTGDADCGALVTGSADVAYVCLPRHVRLCRPCRENSECRSGANDEASLCLPAADPNDGRFCGASCEGGIPCPGGYACSTTTLPNGQSSKQCVPNSGICECRASWAALELQTDCAIGNAIGSCEGIRSCGPAGLTSCEGPIPAKETCNNVDDDCDGAIDDVAADGCTIDNDWGSCPGSSSCANGAPACVGTPPAPDACNGKDDDCDGVMDDGACNDQLACTEDVCSVDLGCQNPIKGGSCLIGGLCYVAGAPNPGDPCESCFPEKSTTAWSDGDGLPCNDGSACTSADVCLSGTCTGAPYACSDGLECTNSLCDGLGGCSTVVIESFCAIEGKCYGAGDLQSVGSCTKCDPAQNQKQWSPAPAISCDDGNPCTQSDTCSGFTCTGQSYTCNDGAACTTDTCNGDGTCTFLLQSGCVIDAQCIPAGTPKPGSACQACQPGLSTTAWTGTTGNACSDGNVCSFGDACQAGVCTGTTYSCNDSLACTNDICDGAGGCQNPLTAGNCLIAGTCYGNGTANPGNPCQSCSSGAPNGWTGNSGGACSDGDACTSGDSCQSGQCVGAPNIDNLEPNSGSATAKNLGNIADGDDYPTATFTASLYPAGDEDWYRFYDKDESFSFIYPRAELKNLPAGVNYDLCLYFMCSDGSGVDLTCDAGTASTFGGMKGCCSTQSATNNENVVLDPNCSGSGDSGNVFVRVYQVSGPAVCGSYSLTWGDD